jgi:hypothetical protein
VSDYAIQPMFSTFVFVVSFFPLSRASTFFPTKRPTHAPSPTMSPTSSWVDVNIFSFVGADIVMTIPENITNMTVYMWGAGGNYNDIDGAGAYVEGVLSVNAGQTITIMVGQGGDVKKAGLYGHGGDYGGGGMSAILLDGIYMVIAGGGGGSAFTEGAGGAATSYSRGKIQSIGFQGKDAARIEPQQTTSCNGAGGGGGGQSQGGCGGSSGQYSCCQVNNGAQFYGGYGGNGGNGRRRWCWLLW